MSILALQIVRRLTNYPVHQTAIDTLSLVMTVALQVTIFFIIAELFRDFYNEGSHAVSARYLLFGLDGHAALRPWIWTAFLLMIVAVTILMIHPLRTNITWLNIACLLTIAGVWIEKGMGLVVPGFVPTPTGELLEYMPNATELTISIGIWAIGLMLFTMMAKAAIPIECGTLRRPGIADKEVCRPENPREW